MVRAAVRPAAWCRKRRRLTRWVTAPPGKRVGADVIIADGGGDASDVRGERGRVLACFFCNLLARIMHTLDQEPLVD